MIFWNVYTGEWEVYDLRLVSPDGHLAWMNELFYLPESIAYYEHVEKMDIAH